MNDLTTFNDLMAYVHQQKILKNYFISNENIHKDACIDFWKTVFRLKNLNDKDIFYENSLLMYDEDIFYENSKLMYDIVFLCINIKDDHKILLDMCLNSQDIPILTILVSIKLDTVSAYTQSNENTHINIIDKMINMPNFDFKSANKYLNLIYDILHEEINYGRIHGPFGAALSNLYDMLNNALDYYNQQIMKI